MRGHRWTCRIFFCGLLLFFLFCLNGCGNRDASEDGATAAGTLEMLYEPAYATGFHIEYYTGGARIIESHIAATTETSGRTQRLLILPEGAEKPEDVSFDYVLDGYLSNAVTLGSAHPGHFETLGAIDAVKGTTIKEKNCYLPGLKKAMEEGACLYVGSGDQMDQELIASLEPQVVFVGGMQKDIDFAHKMEESGIFCFYFGDYAEADYMGRAQWVEVIGAMLGEDEKAQRFIADCGAGIEEIIQRASSIEAKPKVLWFTHSSQVPHWYVKSQKDYVGSIVGALGGELLCPDTDSNSISLSNEVFFQYLLQADRIIFGVSLNSYPDAKDITYFNKDGQVNFAQSIAYQNGQCYVVSNDWAQTTSDVLQIMRSAAYCLYPEEFSDFAPPEKLRLFITE